MSSREVDRTLTRSTTSLAHLPTTWNMDDLGVRAMLTDPQLVGLRHVNSHRFDPLSDAGRQPLKERSCRFP